MEISSFISEYFYLDGGAMFGALPKPVWIRAIPADLSNRIRLAARILVIRQEGAVALVDLGCGRKWGQKQQKFYSFEPQTKRPIHELFPDVTHVILTHLHFDHCGGLTHLDETGTPQLSFPNAVHYVQEKHWQHANNPNIRERASYLKENLEPLAQSKLQFTQDGEEILPGVRVHAVNGHTHALQWVEARTPTAVFAFVSDLLPTAHHLPVQYVMGYDLCAETSMAEKVTFFDRAVEENWTVIFGHDADTAAATLCRNEENRVVVSKRIALDQRVHESE